MFFDKGDLEGFLISEIPQPPLSRGLINSVPPDKGDLEGFFLLKIPQPSLDKLGAGSLSRRLLDLFDKYTF
ncbi:hypothetical protein CVV26_02175 [Candidatus Kuenenbacteria bacterium HGW-Kuenenbacteria-1]|uniref:Uncharacterized protein n=1 Tax=Candidatus Kuenenbacteria bacterium HGW-Kuenenbacteria-1 TaxID=2013812 RepID=A0A2N1UNB9_9BACT|nr:MAG: hypothetical protein CVV26_02175 [Candidatus Kuenenbacteria bacterium HGW-Kuenenbacteria-1]